MTPKLMASQLNGYIHPTRKAVFVVSVREKQFKNRRFLMCLLQYIPFLIQVICCFSLTYELLHLLDFFAVLIF